MALSQSRCIHHQDGVTTEAQADPEERETRAERAQTSITS